MLDLILAVAHHLLVFALAASLFAERILLRAPAIDVRRLAGLDAMYGATSVLVILVGIARVMWGGKGGPSTRPIPSSGPRWRPSP